ncbi:MAG: MFS transporter [Clostridia bacterium]|nr:MFS transporter [Clostridia bacterium]
MKRKLIYLISYLAYSAIYIARVNLTMANPELVSLGIVDTVQIGILGGVFSAMFASGRLFNGAISDKAPPWAMISGGLALCALSNIIIGFFPPFIGILLLWTVNAYAQSMLWGSMLSVMSQIYDESTAKKRTAFLSTSVAVGNIISILFCTWLITHFDVKYAFIIPGVITLILGLAVAITTHDVKPCGGEEKHLSMLELLRRKELCIISIPAFLHGIMKENISLWMTVYVIDTYAIDLRESAYYLLLIPAFGFVGRAVHQVFYKLFKENEHAVSLLGFMLCIVFSVMLVAFRPSAFYSVACLTAIYAAVSMINTSFLSIYPHRYRHEGNVSSVSGIVDFVTYLGAAVGALIYGVMIKSFGYDSMFISWAIASLLGSIVISKFVKIKR